MKKILRKSIASVVSAVLCLTAFVGCLTVSAETGTGTVTIGTVDATYGQDIVVPVTVKADDTPNEGSYGVAVVLFDITFDTTKLTIKDIRTSNNYYKNQEAANNYENSLDYSVEYRPGNDGNGIGLIMDDKNGTARIFAAVRNEKNISVPEMKLYLYFKVSEDQKCGNAAIAISNLQAANNGSYDVNGSDKIYANDEARIKMTGYGGAVNFTDYPADSHNWDNGTMTVMPTTTSQGQIQYTCSAHNHTKTEFFTVTGDMGTYDNPNYEFTTKTDISTYMVRYCARISKEVFTFFENQSDCKITECGILATDDGTVPTIESGKLPKNWVKDFTNRNGRSLAIYYYYNGLSLPQMGKTYTFRTYVKFTRYGQDCYFYSEPYSKKFIDDIRNNADQQYKDLTALFNGLGFAENISRIYLGTVKGSDEPLIWTNDRKSKFDMNELKIQYGALISADLFANIRKDGGEPDGFGLLVTTNGSVPTIENIENKTAENPIHSHPIVVPAGKRGYLYWAYTGLSFKQMGQNYIFRTYIRYKDSNAQYAYIYGDPVSFNFIDALRTFSDELVDQGKTNYYAKALLDYYDKYVR